MISEKGTDKCYTIETLTCHKVWVSQCIQLVLDKGVNVQQQYFPNYFLMPRFQGLSEYMNDIDHKKLYWHLI